jgi:hypothetical protein
MPICDECEKDSDDVHEVFTGMKNDTQFPIEDDFEYRELCDDCAEDYE